MNNTQSHPNLILTNPLTQGTLSLSPSELTQIWTLLDKNPDSLSLSIKLGDFLDSEGVPLED